MSDGIVILTAAGLVDVLAARGHALYARGDKLVITNASSLTDDDRAKLAALKPDLLVILPAFPEPAAAPGVPHSIIQFLNQTPDAPPPSEWTLEPPPDLAGIDEIMIDFETDGLQWHKQDRPCGVSVKLPGRPSKYYPYRHQGFENIDEAVMRRWFKEQVRNKRITNAYTGFEIHMSRADGCDLVDQGNTFSDVMHYAALLDDHRKRFNLNELSKDFLGYEKPGIELDPTRMAQYPPWVVARRAEGDTDTVDALKQIMYPMLDAQDLQRVRALEDDVIPVVCEMEWNGALIDLELLERYRVESEAHYYRCIKEITALCGFNFDASKKAMQRLFEQYKIPLVMGFNKNGEPTHKPSFKDDILKQIKHPVIQKVRYAAQLASLRSKIYTAYPDLVDQHGILRFDINQLRIDDDGGQRGTVSGRFSAGFIQQVPNSYNHTQIFGDQYFPRELYIAPPNRLFFDADAMQIEYRIFASLAQNKRVMDAYAKDPYLSFHKFMMRMIAAYKDDLQYSELKNFNFMKMYNGGVVKTAVKMEFISEDVGREITAAHAEKTDPRLAKAREIEAIYAREMPEQKSLSRKAMHLGMAACNDYCKSHENHKQPDALHRAYNHRGYVKTVLGRRARFPTDYKIHKALNCIIQGSAADIMKTKMVEVFKRRKEFDLTMRMTVHDEVTGDIGSTDAAAQVVTLLNAQSISMAIPILWEGGTGKNWAEAK